jgi:hypothetical protein
MVGAIGAYKSDAQVKQISSAQVVDSTIYKMAKHCLFCVITLYGHLAMQHTCYYS